MTTSAILNSCELSFVPFFCSARSIRDAAAWWAVLRLKGAAWCMDKCSVTADQYQEAAGFESKEPLLADYLDQVEKMFKATGGIARFVVRHLARSKSTIMPVTKRIR